MEEQGEKKAERVFIGMPYYLHAHPAAVQAADHFASKVPGRCGLPNILGMSHHCAAFNGLWSTALNTRKDFGWTHFLMIHQDVAPQPWFVDTLLAEMERTEADVLAVVLPIKDEKGMTSTAVLDKGTLHTRRMSMTECVRHMPVTFFNEDLPRLGWKNHLLLPVAGFFLARFTEPWAEKVWFESASRIVRDAAGNFVSSVWDEGWNISIQMHLAGLRVGATRVVPCNHLGNGVWGNEEEWGEWETDVCLTDYSWILGKREQAPPKPSVKDRKRELYAPPLLIEEGGRGPC